MPLSKSMAIVFKPRNLRIMAISLFLSTGLIGVLHIVNESSGPDPTAFSNLIPVDEDFEAMNLGDPMSIHDGGHFYAADSIAAEASASLSGKVISGLSRSNSSRIRSQNGQCARVREEFKPDFDAADIYPKLQFDGNWVQDREYWNHFFEERYQNTKPTKDTNTLKIFVIPHSHTDPGWLMTFEEYYYSQVKNIIDNAVDKLIEFPHMTFQWSEMSFLSKWWEHAHPTRRSNLRKLVKQKRFEIVTGGWVMTDEATVHLYSMIDQLIEGHQWVKSHLDVVPTTSWSVDPFGHSSTFPYILKNAGISGMVIQRIHYAWKKWLAEKQKGDFEWTQRWDTTRRNSIFCHNNPFDIYSIKHSCGPHPHICLTFDFRNISGEYSENHMRFEPITNRNVKSKSELLLVQYGKAASLFPHLVSMVSLGDDFRFQKSIEWDQQYLNYMKMFNYINEHMDLYHTEIKFGTISEYFEAVSERMPNLPTFSGDFFVYSDIFSDGRPAYWSGYFSTRPFWKKFYRETENSVRSAEILFTFATALARQKNRRITEQALIHEYSNLVTARRWLGLFAHHDATTGTSKVNTMNDYGIKLMDAFQNSLNIQTLAVNSMLFGQTNRATVFTDFEQAVFGELSKKIPLRLQTDEKIVIFNNLAWRRSHIAKVFVSSPFVQVMGPNGQHIPSQINPIVQAPEATLAPSEYQAQIPVFSANPHQQLKFASEAFELSFLVDLPPLSISTYTISKTTNKAHEAIRTTVYCRNCSNPKGAFDINPIQAGNVQLTNDRIQALFDRNTGFLMGMTRLAADPVSVQTRLTYGAYTSVDYRSGAYLLMLDTETEVKPIPFDYGEPVIYISSGPIYSEITASHAPLRVSTRILHVGGEELEEALFITNQIDLGLRRGEVFMRFDTDLKSTTRVKTSADNAGPEFKDVPTFYTDQNGFTVEKRVKIPEINLEGNYYPATSMSFIEDKHLGLRFTVLVDRAQGFSSYEKGRIEAMVERRTVYDDARGMGEGVTDNRDTISNYVILLEKISERGQAENNESDGPSTPTLSAHHLSQDLNYPPSLFVMGPGNNRGRAPPSVFYLLNQELPCDSHLINLRTMAEDFDYDVDTNIPSTKALLITQRLAFHCPEGGKAGCGSGSSGEQGIFYANTSFNLRINYLTQSDLTGINSAGYKNVSDLGQIVALPYEIKSVIINFK